MNAIIHSLSRLEWDSLHDFNRTLRRGESIDEAAITGGYKDGILRLVLPKAEAVTPNKIQVEIH